MGKPQRHIVEQLEPRHLLAGHLLLPDLVPNMGTTAESVVAGYRDSDLADLQSGARAGVATGFDRVNGRLVLRLAGAILNQGQGPFEVRPRNTNPPANGTEEVLQVITTTNGGAETIPAGNFLFHPTHGHFHFEDYANYSLREVLPDGGVGNVVAGGRKVSFCLIDIERQRPDLPGSPASEVFGSCEAGSQGISVGWTDIYNEFLDGQWIDIEDLAEGDYWLEVDIDPDNNLREIRDDNNIGRIKISIQLPQDDHGNSANQATLVTASPVRGSVELGGDVDWFRFQATAGTAYTLETSLATLGDSVIALYGSNGSTFIAEDDDDGTGLASRIRWTPTVSGEYFVEVSGFGLETGAYSLSISPLESTGPTNQRPVVFDAVATTEADIAVAIDVLVGAFDSDGQIDRNSGQIFQTPFDLDNPFAGSIGIALFDINPASSSYQKVVFTPDAGFSGRARFSYNISDIEGAPSNVANVTVTVGEYVEPTIRAFDDRAKTDRSVPIAIDILANDASLVGLDPMSVELDVPNLSAIESVVYDNNPGSATFGHVIFTSSETALPFVSFSYTVADTEQTRSNIATVTVQINAPPVAASFQVSAVEDTDLLIPIVGTKKTSDFDGNVDASSLTVVDMPQNGQISIDSETFQLTYLPSVDYSGPDSFTYYVRDNNGSRSNTATVDIDVAPANDAPRGTDDIARTPTGEAVVINPLANDSDPDGSLSLENVRLLSISQPGNGTVTTSGDGLSFTYTPVAGYIGADFFDYVAIDGNGAASNLTRVHLRVGPQTGIIEGVVYADINNNGIAEPGEPPLPEVQILLTFTEGAYTHTQSARTDANGRYRFVDSPETSYILPPGEYALTEIRPALLVDGKLTPGTPAPGTTVVAERTFSGIQLASGQEASGFAFGHFGLRAVFAANHFTSSVYFASAELGPDDNDPFGASAPPDILLDDRDVWFSFDGGLSGEYVISATSADGAVALDVYDNDLTTIVAQAGPGSDVRVEFVGSASPQFLKVTGTGDDFQISVEPVVREFESPLELMTASVLVGSTEWSGTFAGQFSDQSGYDLSAGVSTSSAPLPWTNLDQISLRFGQAVSITSEALELSGRTDASYDVVGFNYEASSNTATWTLSEPIAADVISLNLSGIGQLVDMQSSGQPLGSFEISVLPADGDQSGAVSVLDLVRMRRRLSASVGDAAYSMSYDLDGSGLIDEADFALSLARQFKSLPAGPIADPSPEAPAAIVSVAVPGTMLTQRRRATISTARRVRANSVTELSNTELANTTLSSEAVDAVIDKLRVRRHAVRDPGLSFRSHRLRTSPASSE